jgi:hypothetical protein
MENSLPMANRRAAPRQRVLKSAKILYGGGLSLDCAVRDLSENGAKIKLENQHALPHKFHLLLSSEGLVRPAQIAWKLESLLGVAFTGPAEPAYRRPSGLRKLGNQSSPY